MVEIGTLIPLKEFSKESDAPKGSLYLVGMGLGNVDDMTVGGMKIVQEASAVFVEGYTSILVAGAVTDLSDITKKQFTTLYRQEVEADDNVLIDTCVTNGDVVLLVAGDPLSATTHSDLVVRARHRGVKVKVIHNTSIMTAVACTGLSLYKFGETVSIPYFTDNWTPTSWVDKIVSNKTRGLHTLCLLDIQRKELTERGMMKQVAEFKPERFMSAMEAAQQLVQVITTEDRNSETNDRNNWTDCITLDTLVIALARVGGSTQQVKVTTLRELQSLDMGPPLHSIVIPGGHLDEVEKVMLGI